jgi:predicted ArsR family transcriptional regulator
VYSRAAELLFGNLAARLEGKHGRDRIAAIVTVLDEYGYLPEVSHRESGAEEITIFHCPLLLLARRHPGTCEAELRCLQMAAPGADVTRVAHRNSGDGVCSFVFRQN